MAGGFILLKAPIVGISVITFISYHFVLLTLRNNKVLLNYVYIIILSNPTGQSQLPHILSSMCAQREECEFATCTFSLSESSQNELTTKIHIGAISVHI